MTKAIFYKEWLKLRWYFLLAFIVSNGMVAYCMLRIDRAIELKGAAHIWEVMVLKNVTFIDLLQYVPLITGIIAALVQFIPEMQRKCLKLTLHLPCSQQKMTVAMLATGVTVLFGCYLGSCSLVSVGLCRISFYCMDLSGTDMETPHSQRCRCGDNTARLFPGRRSAVL